MSISFELLNNVHDRSSFSCGNDALDVYLKTQSGQDLRKNLSAVFVCTDNGTDILGYYTLSQCSVQLNAIPESIAEKLTRHDTVPATLIGRLAVDTRHKGKGYGELLLMDALHRAYSVSRQIASWAVIVDAKDDAAVSFYLRYGFSQFSGLKDRLFLPMKTIALLFNDN